MALRDEIKRERRAVAKNGTRRDKWDYFKDYYMLPTIGILAVIIFGIYCIYTTVTKPDTILSGSFVNTMNFKGKTRPVQELANDYIEYAKIDTKEQDVSFAANVTLTGERANDYQISQVFIAPAQAGALDFVVCPLEYIMDYAYGGMFVDLTTILTEEQLEVLKPYLLYIDMAVYEEKTHAFDNNINASDIPIPDCTKPEDMKEPVPMLINVAGFEKINSVYSEKMEVLTFGACMNAPNPKTISDFVDYIMK